MASIYEDISSDKSNLTDDSKFISAVVKAFPMLVCIYAHIKVKLMETIQCKVIVQYLHKSYS